MAELLGQACPMFGLPLSDLALWPMRTANKLLERELTAPLEHTEREVLDGVRAIHRATESIEHHVEVIEGLATSVEPLTQSVNDLTATMNDLVKLLAPMATAERGVARAEHEVARAERLLRFHRHKPTGLDGDHPSS